MLSWAACGRPTIENTLGVLSLITWSLIIVISIKYLVYVMRADNKGEGGILALMALVRPERSHPMKRWILTAIGLFGAAFYMVMELLLLRFQCSVR